MEVDRRLFLATLGVGALELMSPEDKAEALEHYMEDRLREANVLEGILREGKAQQYPTVTELDTTDGETHQRF